MRIARGNASGRRHLRNPVHTQRSVVCAGDAGDVRIESPCPHASGRRYLCNPVHTQRSVVCAGCLEDAISVTPYIRSGA